MTDPVEVLASWLFDHDEGCGPTALYAPEQPEHWRVEYEAMARALLPQLVAEAVAQEREACAKVADKYANLSQSNDYDRGWCRGAACVADHIRARSKT